MTATISTAAEVQKFRLDELEEFPGNPRQISELATRGLGESLKGLGLLEMPIVNVRDGKKRIVGGHQRIKLLRSQGVTHADCVVVRYDIAAEMAANLSLNNPSIRGDFDVRAAVPIIDQIVAQLPKPDHMGFDVLQRELREQAERLGPLVPTTAENAAPEVVGEPISEAGKVYALGKHRLYCGSFEDVAKLGWPKSAACITDPPYGVAYEQAATGETLENDDLEGEAWTQFLDSACQTILKQTDGPCFVFMSSKEIPALQAAWERAKGVVHRWLIWAKDRFTLGRGDYHHMHEPCLYGYRKGSFGEIESMRTNVLEFPKPQTNELHPTQKPVVLIGALMEDATKKGQRVFDPFVGSGTTLVVAEELGRVCFACEVDRKHVDTVRKRWAEQTNGSGCEWQKLTPAVKAKGS